MKKVELALPTSVWATLKSKYAPDIKQVLVDEFTSGTINIDTQTKGAITKRKGGVEYNPTALTLAFKDQYEAIFSDGVRHLLAVQSGEIKYTAGDRIFNTVVNGTGFTATGNFEFELARDRVYGGNALNDGIVYDRTTSYGGVSYTAPRIKTMGAQAPSSAPTAPGAGAAGGSVPAGAHTYKVTYLYYDFEESNGSAASGVCTVVAPNQTVNLTAVPVGGYGVTARKIYRDDNDGNYVLVGTITNNTATTFSDTAAAGTTPLPTDHAVPPVFGLIALFLDRLFLAQVPGNPSVIYYSEAGFPDIFPGVNFVICNQKDPITALIVYQDKLIVFNRRSMGQILGRTSDQFRYSHIPGSVGCVDVRTIQTRTIDGVPVLVWLSDKGFYAYNGSSITYISEDIEDQVNVNIRQSTQTKNHHTDDTQSDFQAGTASGGIDLDSLPGIITTPNPIRAFDDQADWEGGSQTDNIATKDGTNLLKVPTRFAPTLASGQLTNAVIDGTNLKLTLASNFTGESNSNTGGSDGGPDLGNALAVRIQPTRSCTVTAITFTGVFTSGSTQKRIYSDAGALPGSDLGGVGTGLVAGTKYWLVITTTTIFTTAALGPHLSGNKSATRSGSTWSTYTSPNGSQFGFVASYTVCASAVAKTGQWLSPIYDSLSAYVTTTLKIVQTSSFPGASFCSGAYTTSGLTTLEGSNDPNFVGGPQVSEAFSNVNGTQSYTISGKRYWRIRQALSTTDDRATPTVGTPILKFETTATWVSPAIDATADVTDFNTLDVLSTVPAGTSVTVTVATSSNNISYPDGFVTFGTEVVRRYIKIKVVLTTDTDNITTPSVSSVTLSWTIVANFISASIDTAIAPPPGWGIFQESSTLNGGTLAYYMRSGASLGALSAATFYQVTPESLPPTTVTPLQYVQWKVIITSTANAQPEVDSVTVEWLLTSVSSVRAASIFTDRRYFVSVATLGSDINNVLFELDVNSHWRVHSGLEISTFSFFFNDPYYGSANEGTMFKFLDGFLDDEEDNIAIDIRTKAFDFSSKYGDEASSYKSLYECVLTGIGTGAEYTVQYSVDNGATFTTLLHTSGASTFQSLNNGMRFAERFRVNYAFGNVVSGRTIMIRITTDDEFDIEIHALKIRAWIRNMEQ